MIEFLNLLAGTVALRPYVFVFLTVYLVAACAHMGWRRALCFIPLGYFVAWASEFCSIRWGFPYGMYYYIDSTAGRELWVAGVPFMDSISYVFLSYCSYATAIFLMSPLAAVKGEPLALETRAVRRGRSTLILAALLCVMLDIVIDPVALQGYRWFLGQIYGYSEQGIYFGVPLSNFVGWLVVALALVSLLQALDRCRWLDGKPPVRGAGFLQTGLLGPLLYLGILVFNLSVTFHIGDNSLGVSSAFLIFYTILMTFMWSRYKIKQFNPETILRHVEDFPHSRAAALLGKQDWKRGDYFPQGGFPER